MTPANVPDYNGLRLFQQQNLSPFLYICIAVLMFAFIGILRTYNKTDYATLSFPRKRESRVFYQNTSGFCYRL